MTEDRDEIQITNKIVVTIDICSSSHLIEDLLKTNNIKVWRDLIINIKKYLVRERTKYRFKLYKFTGDGWILLFREPSSGKMIFDVLSGIYQEFDKIYSSKVVGYLDIPPEIYGLTFGIDEGQLIRIKMDRKNEYIGRPINIACRLQGVINKNDINGGFRVFMSNRLFHSLKKDLSKYDHQAIKRSLRNIGGGAGFSCIRFAISDTQFRIIEAIYGTSNNQINVTHEYTKHIKDSRLEVIVSNKIAGSDPDKGFLKELYIKYVYDGKTFERRFKEKSKIQLP